MAVKVSIENFENEVIKSETPFFAHFYSDISIPCKMSTPGLSQIENNYQNKIKVAKINVNFNYELTEKYEVQAAPTLIFFVDGEETERLRGAVRQDEITSIIEKL